MVIALRRVYRSFTGPSGSLMVRMRPAARGYVFVEVPQMFTVAMLPILPFTMTVTADEKRPGGSPEGTVLDRIVDRNAGMLIASVQELVRIPSFAGEPETGAPFGPGPQKALLRVLEIAERLGFSTTNLDNFAGFAEFGSGSEYIMALGHIDTVPEGGDWAYPPFGGEIHEEKIYGRGALDDKGPALAALFGARAVMESGLPLSRRVRVVFGADEETGEEDVRRYLSRERPPLTGFTPDADFPVVFAEKGILWVALEKKLGAPAHGTFVSAITGGTVANMVPDTATAEIRTVHPEITLKQCGAEPLASCSLVSTTPGEGEIHVHARGLSAHASKPEEGKNAIQELLAFLSEQKLSPGGMTDAIRFLCRGLAKETDGKSFGLAARDDVSGALTLNAGMIETRGDLLVLTLDIRYPVTAVTDRILGILREKAKEGGFSARVLKHQPPLHQPRDSLPVTKLLKVYREATGDQSPPVAIGGGTYARRMPNIVAFGPYRPGVRYPIHARDECIAIDELVKLAKIYARAIREMAE